jgi:CheY-like chemotaxis protein
MEHPIRILLAEDDEDDRELFRKALFKVSPTAELKSATNGAELMKFLEDDHRPDIIFLDLNMPLRDGKECLKHIRSKKRLMRVPVIILSTSSYIKDIDDTYHAGADLYVSKPVLFRDQVKVLNHILTLYIKADLATLDRKKFVLNTHLVS